MYNQDCNTEPCRLSPATKNVRCRVAIEMSALNAIEMSAFFPGIESFLPFGKEGQMSSAREESAWIESPARRDRRPVRENKESLQILHALHRRTRDNGGAGPNSRR